MRPELPSPSQTLGVAGSNPTPCMDVFCEFILFLLFCVTAGPPVEGALPNL